MNDADRRYPTEEHQRFAADTRRGAVAVANILEGWLDIQTVLDLGCGTGIWLSVLRDGGRRQVFGVDFERNDPADLAVDSDLILTADLGQKLDLHRRYDLVVCLEVAEHIDAQFADVVVDNCTRHADLILFSAALPGQQGVNHINEQLPQYWSERFRRRGYIVLDLIRPLIWDEPQIPVWYRQNILLFVKNGSKHDETLRARAAVAASGPLDVAHPEYMRWFSWQAQTATADVQIANAEVQTARVEVQTARVEVQTARVEAHTAAAEAECLRAELGQVRHDLAAEKSAHDTIRRAHDWVLAEIANVRAEIATLQRERGVILGSTLWRAMEPLRRLGRTISPSRRQEVRRLVRSLIPRGRRSAFVTDHSVGQCGQV